MRTPVTLLMFIVGLILLFGIAMSIGEVVGSGVPGVPGRSESGENEPGTDAGTDPDDQLTGLSMSADGYLLIPVVTRFPAKEITDFRFTIFTVDRKPVTRFAVEHGRTMRLIVVRRDMTEYQHLTPTMDPDGNWTARVRLGEPGSYHAFATFRPASAAEPVTLGVDLAAPGEVEYGPVAHPSELAEVDEYTVTLDGAVIAGGVSRLYATVLRDGEPVTDLEPYYGANGHLVMLREGDLAFLHAYPLQGTGPGPTITFEARVPTPGFYGVFVEFQHRGEVKVARFTVMAS